MEEGGEGDVDMEGGIDGEVRSVLVNPYVLFLACHAWMQRQEQT